LGKRALLRRVGEPHPEARVAALERELTALLNETGIGPMGLGGRATVLAVHVEYAMRHPASLPVGIVIQCWADRRAVVLLRSDGRIEVEG
ncbi:fumarate hydratase, partial [Candidatus Acetothermia bacterium]